MLSLTNGWGPLSRPGSSHTTRRWASGGPFRVRSVLMARAWIISGGAPATLTGRIATMLGAVARPPRTVRRTWLDSFDWRLWRKGEVLVDEPTGSAHALTWMLLDGRVLLEFQLL